MGTKRPGTSRVTSTTVTVAALGCSHSLQPPTWRLCQSSASARYTISGAENAGPENAEPDNAGPQKHDRKLEDKLPAAIR